MANEIRGLTIYLYTMNENLDIRTRVYADVYHGEDKIADTIQVAVGEVEEWQHHDPVYIPFVQDITDLSNLSIELRHPGIRNNGDPHWRSSFSLDAITSDNRRLGCEMSLTSSPIYVDEHSGQLNFEDGDRNSGRIPFLILT